MKWSISCHINKQGCHSHQLFQPSKHEFLSLENTQEKQCLLTGSHWASGTLCCEHWAQENVERCKIIVSESWEGYERNDFSKPRLLHPPIHRKALNSLTWDIWFSLINNNLLMFRLPAPCCKTSSQSDWQRPHPNSSLRVTWDAVFWVWSLKNSHQIKHNSELSGCDCF